MICSLLFEFLLEFLHTILNNWLDHIDSFHLVSVTLIEINEFNEFDARTNSISTVSLQEQYFIREWNSLTNETLISKQWRPLKSCHALHQNNADPGNFFSFLFIPHNFIF